MARPSKSDALRKAAGELADEFVAILRDEFGLKPDIDQTIAILTRLRAACDRIAANGNGGDKPRGVGGET